MMMVVVVVMMTIVVVVVVVVIITVVMMVMVGDRRMVNKTLIDLRRKQGWRSYIAKVPTNSRGQEG